MSLPSLLNIHVHVDDLQWPRDVKLQRHIVVSDRSPAATASSSATTVRATAPTRDDSGNHNENDECQ